MAEKRFLADFEVETHACLKEDLDKVCATHPQREYEVHISNLAVAPGIDRPLLSVQVFLPANTIEEVKDIAINKLNEYLHSLLSR